MTPTKHVTKLSDRKREMTVQRVAVLPYDQKMDLMGLFCILVHSWA